MLTECIEMETRASPSSHRNRLVKKVLTEEFELRDLPQGKAISCWWITLPVFYYLAVIVGGVMTSISVGDLTAAFATNCVFYANITLKGLDALVNNSKILTTNNVEVVNWGDMDTCSFTQYTSVACVMYAGVLLVMVLQCGRGGGKSAFRGRGIAESWRIVPVAFAFNLLFLILSSIIFSNVQNGFSAFCDGISQIDSSATLSNVSSCQEVLRFSFPFDKFSTNLHIQYVIAKTGSSLQLGGSILALFTIIIRCIIPADFIVYRRQRVMMTPGIQSSYEASRSEASSDSNDGVLTTSVEYHNRPSSVEDGYTNLTTNDNDSVHSARSDVNLVSESSRPYTLKSKQKSND